MNHKHSEPFYISPKLFNNKRLKKRRCKWMQRLRERQQLHMAQMRANALASKTERSSGAAGGSRRQLMLPRRRFAAALPADVTIDLLSDDDKGDEEANNADVQQRLAAASSAAQSIGALYVHPYAPGSLQLSMVPNITLVPVDSSTMLLMPATSSSSSGKLANHNNNNNNSSSVDGKRQRKAPKPRKRHGQTGERQRVTSSTAPTIYESIVLTSDDDDEDGGGNGGCDNNKVVQEEEKDVARNERRRLRINENQYMKSNRCMRLRSPPPLAPLSQTEPVEEVTVSLVPRHATIASCHARHGRHSHSPFNVRYPNGCSTPNCRCDSSVAAAAAAAAVAAATSTMANACNGDAASCTELDLSGGSIGMALPDETTVHTVIANRIYELSLSKLREGLASSGVPEYAHDLRAEQLEKLPPALRAKMLVPSPPPAPISLKLSSDLSISLISDDDECENGASSHAAGSEHPVVAAEAHAAAKLLKQQQPQLSVVQHLQYASRGAPVALALPVAAPHHHSSATPSPRRRKLG